MHNNIAGDIFNRGTNALLYKVLSKSYKKEVRKKRNDQSLVRICVLSVV